VKARGSGRNRQADVVTATTKGITLNGKLAKRLRRLAKQEMSANVETVDRELVVARVRGHDRIVNEPMSVRAFYSQLKGAYKDYASGVRKPQPPQSE
jgi:hypothetical protein